MITDDVTQSIKPTPKQTWTTKYCNSSLLLRWIRAKWWQF